MEVKDMTIDSFKAFYGEENVFEIPDANMERLNHEIEKLNRRAVKLGVPPITLQICKTVEEDVVTRYHPIHGYELAEPITIHKVTHIVTVFGEAPKLNGWTLKATLEHIGDTCLVHCVPGCHVPSEFRNNTRFDCDHCGRAIHRKETHVVFNEETGEYKAVGSGCIKDFLGHKDPKAIARWFTWFQKVINSARDEEEYFGSHWDPAETISLETWLSFVCESVIRNGWLSKSKFEAEGYSGTPTAWDALENYMGVFFPNPKRPTWTPSDEAKKRAGKIVEWARNKFNGIDQNKADEYHYNLSKLIELDYVNRKNQAIIASLVPYYWREEEAMARKEAKNDKPQSQYFAEVKDRIQIEAEVISVKEWNGDWGVAYIHNFLTPEGNQVCWWGSNNNMEAGKTYRFKATVKKLGEWNDEPQTVITRVTSVQEV